ncbi:hypothetical protein BDZ94DRAFT_594234 [Collybia nuda]|uniref:Uncharacterized protein n=1 Tax=Collybia nuda TaxID=64659 RepID=A0A9P5Y9K9_9AGAR|nr:hypothetical protein BDZ94DRAFT_594234 [Collybia nuda]
MESLREDPELAAEMVGLMGRELRIARKKTEELERELTAERKRVSTLEASYTTEKERAEAAEYTRDIFKLNMEKFGKQSKRLLRELEHNKKEIKKEREEFVLGSSSDGGLDRKILTKSS